MFTKPQRIPYLTKEGIENESNLNSFITVDGFYGG